MTPQTPLRPARAALATAVSAGLFALAFPPISWHALGFLALAPLCVALAGQSFRFSALLGWLWGVLAAYAIGVWFAPSMSVYFLQPLWVCVLLFLGVASLMVAPYTIAFALLQRGFAGADARAWPLLVAAAWSACELLRARLFTGTPFFIGNPWGLLGYAQADVPQLIQVASLTGIYGVSFACAGVSAGLAQLWLTRGRAVARSRRGAGLALALAPALLGFGVLSLARAEPLGASSARTVAIVQGNVAVGARWSSAAYGQHLDTYVGLTAEALAKTHVDTVVWPESALSFFLEDEPLYRRALASFFAPRGVELVTGGPRREAGAPERHFNSVWLVTPTGELAARYDKQLLVPLAEYVPFAGLDLVKRRFEGVRFFSAGGPSAPLPTRLGAAGILVCNEAMLPELASARVDQGAEVLVNPSNDSWISHPQYTLQQFGIARVRAVEQRRYLVRASTAGPSAVIDPWGRVVAQSAPLAAAAISAELEPRSERTLYNRVGDSFGVACGVAALAAAWRRRRAWPR